MTAREFERFRRDLLARLERERRPPTASEHAELFRRRDAAEDTYQVSVRHPPAGIVYIPSRPPSRQELEDQFGPPPAAPAPREQPPARPPASPAETRKDRPARRGAPDTKYPRDAIARVLRAHHDPDRVHPPSLRALAQMSGLTVRAVRRILELDDHGAFRVGPRGGLRCASDNGEFRHARKLVSLRALETALDVDRPGD